MKYIKIYEDFDLDKFMQDPEAEFQKNEENPEIEPGDYVTSYRGPGQVIDMDDDFIKIELLISRINEVFVTIRACKFYFQ